MSTDTLERTDPSIGDTDRPDEVFHYARKEDIGQSAVFGTEVVALCGETFPVTKVPKAGSPVCLDCKRIYEQLKK